MPSDGMAQAVKKRYNRIAPLYDVFIRFAPARWWEALWSKVEGDNILEVGVGTGRSFPFYPPNAELTAIDFSVRMLERARNKAGRYGIKVRLLEMDIQELHFEDNTFDTVVASLVFCSVPQPVRGLMEVKRVCKPGGKVVLLEHVLSRNRFLARLMELVNPLAWWLIGDNVNRQTVQDVSEAGLTLEHVTDLKFSIFKLIEARKK